MQEKRTEADRVPPLSRYGIGMHAAVDGLWAGTLPEVVELLIEARKQGQLQLYSGGKAAMMQAIRALQPHYDLADGIDEPEESAFLRKTAAVMEAEIMVHSGDALAWRLRTIGKCLALNRSKIKRTQVIESRAPATTAPTPVSVVSMPDRVTHQTVQRDKDGEITATTQVQRDLMKEPT